jgi:hypothetical protein
MFLTPESQPDFARVGIDPNMVDMAFWSLYQDFICQKLPDLLTTLEEMKAGEGEMEWTRYMLCPRSHLSLEFVFDVWQRVKEADAKWKIIEHAPATKLEDNFSILRSQAEEIAQALGTEETPRVLTTVSIVYGTKEDDGKGKANQPTVALFSRIAEEGKAGVDDQTKEAIGKALKVNSYGRKNITINPTTDSFNPSRDIGVIPGLVKPIVEGDFLKRIEAICFEHAVAIDHDAFVLITVSPYESLIIPVGFFYEAFQHYLEEHQNTLVSIDNPLPNLDIFLTHELG